MLLRWNKFPIIARTHTHIHTIPAWHIHHHNVQAHSHEASNQINSPAYLEVYLFLSANKLQLLCCYFSFFFLLLLFDIHVFCCCCGFCVIFHERILPKWFHLLLSKNNRSFFWTKQWARFLVMFFHCGFSLRRKKTGIHTRARAHKHAKAQANNSIVGTENQSFCGWQLAEISTRKMQKENWSPCFLI